MRQTCYIDFPNFQHIGFLIVKMLIQDLDLLSMSLIYLTLHFDHRGQNSKQIVIAKYVSRFLIYGAKIIVKCVKSNKKIFVHSPFLQSQAK